MNLLDEISELAVVTDRDKSSLDWRGGFIFLTREEHDLLVTMARWAVRETKRPGCSKELRAAVAPLLEEK